MRLRFRSFGGPLSRSATGLVLKGWMRSCRSIGAAGLTLASVAFTGAFGTAFISGCTSPVTSSTDEAVTAQGKLLAFSYDASLDQFTHMSCSNMPMASASSFNTSAYFTYRMGAYSRAGITLNDAFYTSLKKYTFEQQGEILAASPANSGTVLQLSMRGRLDYQNLYVKSGTTAVANQDYFNMLTPLGTSDVAQLFVNNPAGGRIKHIRNGSPGGFLMEGSLYDTDSAPLTQATRNFLQGVGNLQGNAGVMTLTYSDGGMTKARSAAGTVTGSAANSSRAVYGRGYSPTFSQPAVTGLYSGYPQNVVTNMQESSLDSTIALPTLPIWTCPTSLQLRIVRGADVGLTGTNCVRKSDPNPLPADLAILRNTLKVEDWYIDLADRCMIAKRSGMDCYGSLTNIKYTMGDTCKTDGNGFSDCVQYASTCYRSN